MKQQYSLLLLFTAGKRHALRGVGELLPNPQEPC